MRNNGSCERPNWRDNMASSVAYYNGDRLPKKGGRRMRIPCILEDYKRDTAFSQSAMEEAPQEILSRGKPGPNYDENQVTGGAEIQGASTQN